MLQAALAVLALAACAAPATASARQPDTPLSEVRIDTLAVQVVEADSEFTVIDSRMDETATAAVLFGLVGAAINSADNNSEDEAKARPLQATAQSIDLDTLIGEAIRTRLAAGGDTVRVADPPASASNALLVEIGEWGLVRRARGDDKTMRTFLKLNLSILDARRRTLWGPEREHSIGQLNAELSAFTPEVFRSEMEALAARAGRQVANRLIYR